MNFKNKSKLKISKFKYVFKTQMINQLGKQIRFFQKVFETVIESDEESSVWLTLDHIYLFILSYFNVASM